MSGSPAPCVLVVAAEASGDALAAALIAALKRRAPGPIRFVGVGGSAMAGEGVASAFDIAGLSVAGWFEGLAAYGEVKRRVREVAVLAAREHPDVAVLVDSWGFTLRVAQALRALPNPPTIIKYVAPQVWASRPGRAKTLAAAVDHLLTIHAFDAPFFEREGLKTTFVGQAALARDASGADPASLRARLGLGAEAPVLLLLPGSRPGEIRRVLPAFAQTASRLKAERPALQVLVPVASTVRPMVEQELAGAAFAPILLHSEADKWDAMALATAALACSGTVTTELAQAGCPFVVGYRASTPTYLAAKLILKTRWLTLLNIAAGEEVAPEFLQDRCAPGPMAAALALLLDDPSARTRQIDAQNAALAIMRGPQAAGRAPQAIAAEVVLQALANRASLAQG